MKNKTTENTEELKKQGIYVGNVNTKNLDVLTWATEVRGNIRIHDEDVFPENPEEKDPKKVKNVWVKTDANLTKSFKWIKTKKVTGTFNCIGCKLLTSLDGCPEEVGGDFKCWNCDSLTSLKGAPKKVAGEFSCWSCSSLETLEGAPEEAGSFNCANCRSLTTLKGAPKKCIGEFDCRACPSLVSLGDAIENRLKIKDRKDVMAIVEKNIAKNTPKKKGLFARALRFM